MKLTTRFYHFFLFFFLIFKRVIFLVGASRFQEEQISPFFNFQLPRCVFASRILPALTGATPRIQQNPRASRATSPLKDLRFGSKIGKNVPLQKAKSQTDVAGHCPAANPDGRGSAACRALPGKAHRDVAVEREQLTLKFYYFFLLKASLTHHVVLLCLLAFSPQNYRGLV